MGIQLDVLVEKVIFGRDFVLHPGVTINEKYQAIPTWLERRDDPNDPPGGTIAGERPPRYSKCWKPAFEVQQRICGIGHRMLLQSPLTAQDTLWRCCFLPFRSDYGWSYAAPDGPAAICGAALLACGVPEEKIDEARSQA